MTFSGLRQTRKSLRTSGNRTVVIFLIFTASLFPACSGIKTYENNLNKNVHVRTTTNSGSWLSSIHTAVDIHRVEKNCATNYEGTVQLSESTTDIGLPPDRWTHLVFVFASSSFLTSRSGTTTYETLLKPQLNYRYDVAVTYQHDMYNVAIREIPPNQSAGHDLDPVPLRTCRASAVR